MNNVLLGFVLLSMLVILGMGVLFIIENQWFSAITNASILVITYCLMNLIEDNEKKIKQLSPQN